MDSRLPKRACLFVDWNSQLLDCPAEFASDPVQKCKYTLGKVGKSATQKLRAAHPTARFRVRIRLYHGWMQGFSQTENRRAFSLVSEFHNPNDIFPSANVIALSEVEFGDRLIDALPERAKNRAGIHLPNTLRRQHRESELKEKMVDTALAADLLSWAKAEPTSIALVFSSDDDIVPPVFTAEAWMRPVGGEIQLIRSTARSENKFLALEGLLG